MIGCQIHAPYKQMRIDHLVKSPHYSFSHQMGRRGIVCQIGGGTSWSWHTAAIMVGHDFTMVHLPKVWQIDALAVIAYIYYKLIGEQPLVEQCQSHFVNHLTHHYTGLCHIIGLVQHLSTTETF